MRVYTLFILFSFFQILFCDLEGLSISKLNEIYVKSLPYMKAFHPEEIKVPTNFKYLRLKFNYDELTKNNTNFTYDEFNVLHVKFVNLQAKLNGSYRIGNFWDFNYQNFTAILDNITYEQSFNVVINKQQNGTKTFKYKKIGETEISFKVKSFNFTADFSKKELYLSTGKSGIRNLNFKEFRTILSRMQTLLLDQVAIELAK
jgi:hypothetical protein